METVSLVITSCARMDLLEQTLASFHHWNSYPLSQVIVTEDSPYGDKVQKLLDQYDWGCPVKLIANGERIGQLASIDKAYAENSSEYVFHCEDDWEFSRKGFIEDSLEVLKQDREAFCVWIRERSEFPDALFSGERYYDSEGKDVGEFVVKEICSFNPSLRRASDFGKYLPLVQFVDEIEAGVSQVLEDAGMHSILLDASATQHIGWHRRLDAHSQDKAQWIYDWKDRFKRLKSKLYKVLKRGHFKQR
ncbi:glycosyltransferase [Rubritalea tangerina]|uniref:Glycosyltransferase n=1 Tax=Rubritalea tangerina TaxID=430798 RepID=A0ABW4ZC92_9BACT